MEDEKDVQDQYYCVVDSSLDRFLGNRLPVYRLAGWLRRLPQLWALGHSLREEGHVDSGGRSTALALVASDPLLTASRFRQCVVFGDRQLAPQFLAMTKH